MSSHSELSPAWRRHFVAAAERTGDEIARLAKGLDDEARGWPAPAVRPPSVQLAKAARWPTWNSKNDPWLDTVRIEYGPGYMPRVANIGVGGVHAGRRDSTWRDVAKRLRTPREAALCLRRLRRIKRWMEQRVAGLRRARAEFERQQARWIDEVMAEGAAAEI